MTKKKNKLDLLKAIKVLVTPWKLGFTVVYPWILEQR